MKQTERTDMSEDQPEQNSHEKRTKDLHVHIPWGLAERIRDYAMENETTTTNVVIEALDVFLRGRAG